MGKKKKRGWKSVPTGVPQPEVRPSGSPAPELPIPSGSTSEQLEGEAKAQLADLLSAVERLRDSRVIAYWLTDMGRISVAVVMTLFDQLGTIGKTPKIDLFLYTTGGDVEVPIRIVTLVREYCDQLGVLIPHRALSAGTLLAMGADEIVMTPLSVLGPIDPTRSHPLLPRREGATESEPISVQDMRHAMDFIRKAAGEGKEMPYTPEAMAQIFTALFDKIHPLAIGAIEQSYSLAKLVGKKCLSTHMDPTSEEAKIDGIVDRLCDDYKSHAYQIGRKEARSIGLKVLDAPHELELAMVNLFKFYLGRPIFAKGAPQKGKTAVGHIAWLDSTARQFRVDANFHLEESGALRVLSDQWVQY